MHADTFVTYLPPFRVLFFFFFLIFNKMLRILEYAANHFDFFLYQSRAMDPFMIIGFNCYVQRVQKSLLYIYIYILVCISV